MLNVCPALENQKRRAVHESGDGRWGNGRTRCPRATIDGKVEGEI